MTERRARTGGAGRLALLVLGTVLVSVACGATGQGQPALAPSAIADVGGLEWTLTSLGGQPVTAGRLPTLLLATDRATASGFTGCNRFTGGYVMSATSLRFGPLAMTRAACVDPSTVEDRYMAALAATRGYRLAGKDLELLGEGGVLARFRRP